MIKKYNEFINEGILDLLSGYSMDEIKEKLKNKNGVEIIKTLKKLKLKLTDVFNSTESKKIMDDIQYELYGLSIIDKLIKLNRLELNYTDVFEYDENYEYNDNFILRIDIKYISKLECGEHLYYIKVKHKTDFSTKAGVIDEKLNIIVPIIYDEIYYSDNCFKIAKKQKNYCVINVMNNKIMIPLIYDKIIYNGDNIYLVRKNKKYQVISINNWDFLTPTKYDSVSRFKKNKAIIKLDDKKGTLDINGNETWL